MLVLVRASAAVPDLQKPPRPCIVASMRMPLNIFGNLVSRAHAITDMDFNILRSMHCATPDVKCFAEQPVNPPNLLVVSVHVRFMRFVGSESCVGIHR